MPHLIEEPPENVIFDYMKRIVISVTNDLTTDQRVHRVALTLMKQDCDVMLVGRLLPSSLPITRDYATHRMRLLFKRSWLFYAAFNIRLFFYLLFKKVDILVSNDLDTLPVNYLISLIKRKTLVYDSHEYFTGVPEIQDRKLIKATWEAIERFIFPKLKHIITVNNSIANIYKEKYNKPIAVIRNVPIRITKENWPDRTKLGLPIHKKIIVLQGAGINIHRGAEEAVQAMSFVENAVLLIIGGGDVIDGLKDIVVKEKLAGKVIFKPKMPYEELLGYTRNADLGLSLDKDINLNYRFSLPNKLFDYIQAEIPILCSNLVEVAHVVNHWNVGTTIDCHDPRHIATKINEIFANEAQVKKWKQNLTMAAKELCWEKEEIELLKIYEPLLK